MKLLEFIKKFFKKKESRSFVRPNFKYLFGVRINEDLLEHIRKTKANKY